MSTIYDLVIIGGGCAGLSLSMELAQIKSKCPDTLILESREYYQNDRTWCFWSDKKVTTAYPSQHIWQKMTVSNLDECVVLDCGKTPYHMVSATDFYSVAQAMINLKKNINIEMNSFVVGEPKLVDKIWNISTNNGFIKTRTIVDTRPGSKPCLDGSTLWQSFYGQEIECIEPVFNPEILDLMNFLPPHERGASFLYVLPTSKTRAVIEVTVFGASPLEQQDLQFDLDVAIAKRVGTSSFKVIRSEHGILPMGLQNLPMIKDRSYINAGVMAGGARPSTGYAFQRIQAWAKECANEISISGFPLGHKSDPYILQTMDKIFLDVLRREPLKGGIIFYSLFSGAKTASVIRFLRGKARLFDSLAVVYAMPYLPFIKSAFLLFLRSGRSRLLSLRSTL
ncbi:lycopene cyclase family protein [Polynucleobacter antarcticus]|uniref:Lycopene cyclase n=1 Tax=Polynucleobacter antarcticus TaxID=1743162 RepID=A0A6M9PJ16_9BURK|nr:lycopene cyclase family protein [Polynucleobacter antarcticus]QKM62144.1 hypothetical protein DCO16_03055 [Polynucleobacter antarcticus]